MSFEKIYDESYHRILITMIDGKDFFTCFYDNFLNASQEVRNHFSHTDMEAQKSVLKKSFYNLLVFYGSNQADDYIIKIATAHDKYHLNIDPELYDLWLDNLIRTVSTYDPIFCDDIELAWRLVFTPGITYMKFKHSHCDAPD